MTSFLKLAAIAALFTLWISAGLSYAEKFNFVTSLDQFEFSTDSPQTDATAFADSLKALTNPLGAECPSLKGRPEITARVNGGTARSVYLRQGLVTDGKSCLMVAGDGLFYLPLHREFVSGPKRDTIELKSPVKIVRGNDTLLEIKKSPDGWINQREGQLLDWDFIERFENSLKDFSVRLRVQTGIAQNKAGFTLLSGGQRYEFYRVTDKMWAVKKPGAKWLVASDDWSFWYDFDGKILEDRHTEAIRLIADSSQDLSQRTEALNRLEASWSPNLRELYHKLILNQQEDPSVQSIALKRLKRKPSLATSGVMLQFAEQSTNEELKKEAFVILKLQYPKGPKYNVNGSPEEKRKILDDWRKWWKQQSRGSS